MRARADQVERTRTRVMSTVAAMANEKPLLAITLPDIASGADVSVQTVLRQFGSRDGLLDATTEYVTRQVAAERRAQPGDIDGGLRLLGAHYEDRGDGVLLLLGQERWDARAAAITTRGRMLHRQWVEETFGPHLPEDGRERDELTDLLVVATDVYTWKLLRRDRGLSQAETVHRMRTIITALLKGT